MEKYGGCLVWYMSVHVSFKMILLYNEKCNILLTYGKCWTRVTRVSIHKRKIISNLCQMCKKCIVSRSLTRNFRQTDVRNDKHTTLILLWYRDILMPKPTQAQQNIHIRYYYRLLTANYHTGVSDVEPSSVIFRHMKYNRNLKYIGK